MEHDIIAEFSIKELNVILGGIKRRNIYDFLFVQGKRFRTDISFELIKSSLDLFSEAEASFCKFYTKFTDSFNKPTANRDILIVNYNEIQKNVQAYFDNSGINLSELYVSKDIYQFLDILGKNPVTEQYNDCICRTEVSNGSVITFNLKSRGGGFLDDLVSVDTPDDFLRNNIIVHTSPFMFDQIYIKKEGEKWIYNYPFKAVSKSEFENAIKENSAKLFKFMDVNVDTQDEKDLLWEFGITKTFNFRLKIDILFNEIVENE